MPPQITHCTVRNGSVELATTDFGGTGPDVLLMHGLGLSRQSLTRLATRLTSWRVITMDLRGHGESTTASWSFEQVTQDVGAVIRRYNLDKPLLAGHSLGGMVALRYAVTGLPVAGAINIDGWGPGIADRYVGEDPTSTAMYLEHIAEGHLPTRRGRLLTGLSRQWREGTAHQVLRQLHGVDVLDWHRQAPCPSLAVLGTAPTSRSERWLLGRRSARRQDAHRRGLDRDLRQLVNDRPHVRVVHVDATHAMCTTHPGAVAAAMLDFRGMAEEQVARQT